MKTGCCVIGGGPAGVMLGYLLARAGVQVTVLEKHTDFFRDFRGDTIHPSTLEVMHELGLLERLLQVKHSKVNGMSVTIGGLDGQASNGTLAPGQPGVYAVQAIVPSGVSGDQLPVVVTVAGQSSPAQVTMAVQ